MRVSLNEKKEKEKKFIEDICKSWYRFWSDKRVTGRLRNLARAWGPG